tara:strand:- start:249 stop:1568 length:1320 start_codon:yes stop_codon:yes gene_type:complete
MPRKIKEYSRQDLIDVVLPNHADTYTVISHKSVMDLSTEALKDAGFLINNEGYRATYDGNIASAVYTLTHGTDPELAMMFAWTNSYNKQVRFKCGVGAIMHSTNSTMVCADMGSWARKHTGTADSETEETITKQVKKAKMYYNQLVQDKESMKLIPLNKRKQSQLLGILFAEHDILGPEQANIIKQQMNRSTYNYTGAVPGESDNNTLWAFYNFVTLALQKAHPKTWMEDQRILHWFISDSFKFDKVADEDIVALTEETETEIVDPNQVDLEDMIAEVEADAEMQEIKTEEIINEKEEEDKTPIVKAKDTKPFPAEDEDPVYDEDQIAERIKEDEATVAKVCDESKDIKIHVETDEEYQKRVAEIEGEITDTEAEELIAGQNAIDLMRASEVNNIETQEELKEKLQKTIEEKADFDLDFTEITKTDDDVNSDDVDFDFA